MRTARAAAPAAAAAAAAAGGTGERHHAPPTTVFEQDNNDLARRRAATAAAAAGGCFGPSAPDVEVAPRHGVGGGIRKPHTGMTIRLTPEVLGRLMMNGPGPKPEIELVLKSAGEGQLKFSGFSASVQYGCVKRTLVVCHNECGLRASVRKNTVLL